MSTFNAQRWCCGVCTFSNVSATRSCEMCQTPRTKPVAAPLNIAPVPAPAPAAVIMPVTPPAAASSAPAHPRQSGNSYSHPHHQPTNPHQHQHQPQRHHSSFAASQPPPLQRVSSFTAASLPSGYFQCQQCTFIGAIAPVCEVCGARYARYEEKNVAPAAASSSIAQPAASSSSPSSNTWNCVVCTVLNPNDAVRCAVCSSLSPYAQSSAAAAASSHPSAAAASSSSSDSSSSSTALLDSRDEQAAAAQYQEILSICSATDNQFTDDSFRPGDRALYGSDVNVAEELKKRRVMQLDSEGRVVGTAPWGPFTWKRGGSIAHISSSSSSSSSVSSSAHSILPLRSDGVTLDLRPSDIRQGSLGDCWFISALCVLAERPHLIQSLILTPRANTIGVYQMRFCKNGQWKVVTVDDFLPVHPSNHRLAFAHCAASSSSSSTPNINTLWLPLLEKAYSKLHGSFSSIESGAIYEAFSDLTGAPSERIELQTEEMTKSQAMRVARACGGNAAGASSSDNINVGLFTELLFATLASYRSSRFLMGASCGRRGASPEAFTSVGLLSDHAYAILDVRAEKGRQFIQLRNPWGNVGAQQQNWTGDWSHQSKMWTPEWRELLNYPSHNNHGGGIFWIEFHDFLKFFRTVDVCKYQENWNVTRLKDEFALANSVATSTAAALSSSTTSAFHTPASLSTLTASYGWCSTYMYEISITTPTWCFIEVIQEDQRGVVGAVKPYVYKSLGLFLLKSKGKEKIEQSLGKYQRCTEIFPETQRTATCETLLTDVQGRYIILPCSYASTIAANPISDSASPFAAAASSSSSTQSSFPFILCIYSAHPIVISRRPAYLPSLTISQQLSTIHGESKTLSEHCTLYTYDCQGGLWFMIVNRHATKYLSISLDCSGSVGLIPSRGSAVGRNAFQTMDYIPPRHRQILVALITPCASSGYSFKRSCTFVHTQSVSGQLHQPPLRKGYDIHQPVPIDHSFVPQIL